MSLNRRYLVADMPHILYRHRVTLRGRSVHTILVGECTINFERGRAILKLARKASTVKVYGNTKDMGKMLVSSWIIGYIYSSPEPCI